MAAYLSQQQQGGQRTFSSIPPSLVLRLVWFFLLFSSSSALSSNLALNTNFISILSARQSQSTAGVCSGNAFGEFVPNPYDCRLFYLCMESGEAVTASCPPTMLFNPVSKLCDTASNVICAQPAETTTQLVPTLPPQSTPLTPFTNEPLPVTTPSSAVDPPNEQLEATRYCAALELQANFNQLSFIGSSVNCQQYYICYYGQAIRQQCSANLHWNANIGKCDLPINAKCELPNNNNIVNWPSSSGGGSASTDTDTGGSSSNSIGDFINCPAYGRHLFPHMERCEFFIYCVKGNAILQRCPFYYHFDIVTKSCKMRPKAICVRQLNINF